MRASSKRPRVESFGIAPPPPSSTSDTTVEESVDPAATVVAAAIPPPSTSNDSNICHTLETVMTVQALMVSFWRTCLMSFVPCEQI